MRFQDRYEISRRNNAILGIFPSGESLSAADLSCYRTENRLEVWLDATILNGVPKMFKDVLFMYHFLVLQ
jgi:hypothetical protein